MCSPCVEPWHACTASRWPVLAHLSSTAAELLAVDTGSVRAHSIAAALSVQITWYELPSFYIFHIANAWEEDGKVKVSGAASATTRTQSVCCGCMPALPLSVCGVCATVLPSSHPRAIACIPCLLSCAAQVYACEAPRVDLAAMKFNEDMGSRLTEYVIDTAAGTASRRQVRRAPWQ